MFERSKIHAVSKERSDYNDKQVTSANNLNVRKKSYMHSFLLSHWMNMSNITEFTSFEKEAAHIS